jgi:hypothetical protein
MEPRIGHWHCRYRLVGAQSDAALAVERLERTIRPRALEAYRNALAQALENNPAVYVLRRVNASLMLGGVNAETETTLAHKWGHLLGASVMRSIVAHDEDSGNLIRFDNEADYVAHFIVDLLDDLAWQRWYYGPFSKLRGRSKADAIPALLLERREMLAAILRYLSSLGGLDRVLALLDRPTTAALWTASVRPAAAPSSSEFQIFVRSAIRLLERLGLWAASPPAEAELLEAYLAERPVQPDWTDRRSLAAAVINVVRYAARRAYLRGLNYEQTQKLSHAREHIFSELDWLDTEWLEATLLATLAGGSQSSTRDPLPARLVGSTPLQRKLLERIRDLLRDKLLTLDLNEVDSPANAMRLYSALAAAEPELASQPAAASLIENLLRCGKWLMTMSEPGVALAAVRAGSAETIFELLPPAAHDAIRSALSLGSAATAVLEELVGARGGESKRQAETVLPTECAGLFLLICAVMDIRLPQLAGVAGAGPLSSVLLALGIQWAGASGLSDGKTDPGLAFWCGLAPQAHVAAHLLSELDEAGCQRLLLEVRELFEKRRALDATLRGVESPLPDDSFADLAAAWPSGTRVHEALALVAMFALRLWAQWLPAISGSSVPYLLGNLVRRGGALHVRADSIEVILRPAPLDIVLEMSTYKNDLSKVPWLEDRRVVFRIDRS